ncbi:flagellar hook-basal body protein [Holophaga foetida]|uniref:flagellar hook-basal body protein n=1 Tax=Holophaga foetida TaxID=35839 RepID=UPI0002472A50|nr:flagellar hook-basal body protein [Holophaga foetida]
MDPAYYVAAGSLKARAYQLDTVSNNIANASTVGYKTERTFFSIFNKAAAEGRGLPLSKDVNDGTVLAQRGTDFSQGALKPTQRKMDLAIEGNAFFTIQTPQGIRATRDGRFKIGEGGEVQASDGSPLLGKNGQTIKINPSEGDISVQPDGTIQQGKDTLGQLDLKAYANPTLMERAGSNRYVVDGVQETGVNAKVSQGYLEQSGVDLASAMVDMINLNRLFEMSLKVASTISNDLDAKALSDVATSR